MMRYASIPVLLFVAALAPARVYAQSRIPITAAQIASAIDAAGMSITPDQVTPLVDMTTTGPFPVLLVESMQPWGAQRMRIRIRCADSAQCLPFFVLVRMGDKSAAGPQRSVGATPALRSGADPKSYLVHSGSPATLFLEGVHVHIRIAVVCLENGAAGQTIRVASNDHRQTYEARVVDQAVLRASL